MSQNQNQVGSRKSEVGETDRLAVAVLPHNERSRSGPQDRSRDALNSDPQRPTSDLRLPISKRSAFTLIELLVAITIIGILSSIALAALMRARQAANVANTKSTIARLHSQIQTKWDSYRIRKVPIDPRTTLMYLKTGAPTPQLMALAMNAQAFIGQLWVNRGSLPNDPLNVPVVSPLFPSIAQVSAVRLMAIRELQRYEMPSDWADFVQVDTVVGSATYGCPIKSGVPPQYQLLPTNILVSPPAMAYAYLRKLNAASPPATYTATQQQQVVGALGQAECLYMVVTSGLEDVAFGGELSVPKSVGDADGDGLPEFQDAWAYQPDTLHPWRGFGPQQQPISWIRWPAGFRNSATNTVSDLDPDPTQPNPFEFSVANHDYFDTLKVDTPVAAGLPRGFGMTPLVFSAGPDGVSGLSSAVLPMLDPYDLMSGAPVGGLGWTDNIHNHLIEAR